MRQKIHYLLLIALTLLFTACVPVEDDIFTTARITVDGGDHITVTGLQTQVKLTNVNTRQVTTTADFQGSSTTVELLRGAYQIDIEGVATCQMTDGQTSVHQFRCQSDYVELVQQGLNEITLNIIYLD
jgi:hypothetical protein